jgi:hypothetical protein
MAVLAILLLLGGLPAAAQSAQTAQAPQAGRMAQAILESGPTAVRGLPFFPPNVLAADRGEYLAGQQRVEVYFTREPLVLPAGWRKAPCGQEALLRLDGEERPTFCYVEPVEPGDGGYALFLSFASEDFPWCAWTQAFLQRLRSLLTFSQGPAEVPFPAVLEYRSD